MALTDIVLTPVELMQYESMDAEVELLKERVLEDAQGNQHLNEDAGVAAFYVLLARLSASLTPLERREADALDKKLVALTKQLIASFDATTEVLYATWSSIKTNVTAGKSAQPVMDELLNDARSNPDTPLGRAQALLVGISRTTERQLRQMIVHPEEGVFL